MIGVGAVRTVNGFLAGSIIPVLQFFFIIFGFAPNSCWWLKTKLADIKFNGIYILCIVPPGLICHGYQFGMMIKLVADHFIAKFTVCFGKKYMLVPYHINNF